MTDDAVPAPPSSRPVLTPREIQCVRLAAQGKSTAEAAAELNVSERTIEFHIGNATRKLGAQTKLRAVVIAIQQQLIDP